MPEWVPDDVTSDILLWLPVPSLLRFRSACKHWRSLIDSSEFIQRGIDRNSATTTTHDIFILTGGLHSYIYSIPYSSGRLPEILPRCRSRLPFKKGAVICGASRGLVCLADAFTTVICILNPATRRHHITQAPVSDRFVGRYHKVGGGPMVWMLSGYGFGYDSGAAKDYKFVRVCCMRNKSLGRYESEVVSLGIRSNTLQAVRLPNNLKRMQQRLGVLVGEALHWPFRNGEKSIVIVAYDLGTNQCREIPLLPEGCLRSSRRRDKAVLKLTVLRSCLCLCEFEEEKDDVHVWMMAEYGVKTSWTKLCSVVDLPLLPWSAAGASSLSLNGEERVPLALSMNGDEVVMRLDGGRLVCYDVGKEKASRVMYWVDGKLVSADRGKNMDFRAIACFSSLARPDGN